ncbi:hypothetical protein [Spongiactinospora sp. TRM90649]|uniref:hypothetical protein n=1 Tax=Spongiactinospora sp. TRM90649 TaxID=3031114 RepID=UPI0023F643C2|nr:hypothetical protein [Spongiactinospora sp. TRM90649]MDF5756205.1 hypothetical protein [Spongiactinospora sp. TRM90649]
MRGEVVVAGGDAEVPDSFHAAVGLAGAGTAMDEAVARLRAGWQGPGRLVLVTGGDTAYADAVLGGPPDVGRHERAPGRFVPPPGAPETVVPAVLRALGPGAARRDGEREVPLEIWRTPTFRRWYAVQRTARNRLVGARPVWSFHSRSGLLFFWALHVTVYVAAERRTKQNEVVLARPDTASVLLHHGGPSPADTVLVLVREYRSPGTAADGFVHELPGGSGPHPAMHDLAAAEVWEETGLRLDPARLRRHGHRPVAATVSAHHAHLYSAELTDAELEWFRRCARPGGDTGRGEVTWPALHTFDAVMSQRLVDWTTLGMISQVLFGGRCI